MDELDIYETAWTIFCDLDGTVVTHHDDYSECGTESQKLLPGVKEKFDEWKAKKHKIILVTGRGVELEEITKEQLKRHNLPYDKLIMEVGAGPRILINDEKTWTSDTARGIVVKRNGGLGGIDI